MGLLERLDVALGLVPVEATRRSGWLNATARELGDRIEAGPGNETPLDPETRRLLSRFADDEADEPPTPIRSTKRLASDAGGPRALETRAIPVRAGDSLQAFVCWNTIEGAAARTLDEVGHRYETLVKQAPDPIGVHRNGKVLFANEAAADLLGFDHPSQLVGQNVLRFVHPDDKALARERLQQLEEGEDVGIVEEKLVDQDGEIHNAEVSASRVLYEGEPATQLVLRDVTEHRRSQRKQALREAESEVASENMEQLGQAIRHDVRSPLSVVDTFLERLSQRENLDDQTREDLRHAKDTLEQAQDRLEGIVRFSELSPGEPTFEPVDLGELVDDVLESCRIRLETTNAQVEVRDLPVVYGDAGQLERVFSNLVSNAIKYRGEGPPRIEIQATAGRDVYRVRVRDHGEGMTEEEISRATDRFERLGREGEGEGLGLTLCERIMEQFGGTLEIDSRTGHGTTITLVFPKEPPGGQA